MNNSGYFWLLTAGLEVNAFVCPGHTIYLSGKEFVPLLYSRTICNEMRYPKQVRINLSTNEGSGLDQELPYFSCRLLQVDIGKICCIWRCIQEYLPNHKYQV